MWRYGIEKEVNTVMIAFKLLDEGEKPPHTYQEIICHMIFDINMEDFCKKARYVAGVNATVAPTTLTYASVVSRESVRIAITLDALNYMEVKTSDIQNAYLTAPCSEKIWTTLGSSFCTELSGKKSLVVRSFYGIKYSGASFINYLAEGMRNLGYSSCLVDPDLWFKE